MKTLQLFLKHPVLFIVGSFILSLLFLIPFSLICIFMGFDAQMTGRMAGPIILFICIPSGGLFVRFINQKTYTNFKVHNPLHKLNTPNKRKIFLFVPAGFILMILSYLMLEADLDRFCYIIFRRIGNWDYVDGVSFLALIAFWLGILSSSLGLLLSFTYDKTLGAICSWIKDN